MVQLSILLTLLATPAVLARERLTPYLVPDSVENTGIAVIVCPGGSYSWHDMQTEGVAVARWLNQNGINAYVLRYRVAGVPAYIFGYRVLGIGHRWPEPLEDVLDALNYVYAHADEHHVDTARIGVMGFSAGGHLTMSSYCYNPSFRDSVTPSFRPKFLAPIYPVVTFRDDATPPASTSDSSTLTANRSSLNRRVPLPHARSRRAALGVWQQWDMTLRDSLSIELHIGPDCPPTFLVACQDDPTVRYENSLLLDSALSANHVPHTFLLFRTGGHGFGASDTKGSPECRTWRPRFIDWVKGLFFTSKDEKID